MTKRFHTILLLVSLLKFAPAQGQPAVPFVIPALKSWISNTGFFQLKNTAAIVMSPVSARALQPGMQVFLSDLKTTSGFGSLRLQTGTPDAGDVFVALGLNDTALGDEGYVLEIGKIVSIKANTPTGAFWATRTFLQLLEQNKKSKRIAAGIARDFPDYPVRGFVLDAGRKFFTMDFLRNYVKFMAYYKMNDFHIHLNDNGFKKFFNNDWDQTYSAFRLESSTYPELTARDGHYTKREFRELQLMARNYGVNIIPEIDVPAHSLAFSKAVPGIGSRKYGMDHLDITNPKTYEVIDHVFREYLEGPNPVFVGKEVHIGTDEYAKEESENFRKFADHYIRFVEQYGKKVRMWGSLTHAAGTTPVKADGVTMNLWYNGYADPKEMFRLGYKGISTPDGYLYIVPAAGYYYDYLNTRMLYNSWAPYRIGKDSFDVRFPQIRGGAFAVWNDIVGNGISEKDVHHRVFPAMQVLSQKMWTAARSALPYETFMTRAMALPEAPGLNLLGRFSSERKLVLAPSFSSASKAISKNTKQLKEGHTNILRLAGGNSYYALPYNGIGYDYTVVFEIRPAKNNPGDAVLFSSPDAIVKLQQGNTGNLGFSRDGYDFTFNYKVPADRWTRIAIAGNNKGTRLYVNGELADRLEGQKKGFANIKDSINIVQTLFFPLKYIGAKKNAFSGSVRNLKVYNYMLTPKELAAVREPEKATMSGK
ncbi:family 20 glycosylhydrolase [Niabella aurantiaca]|uniref:family 20 glycosylhydrolase n=1 Tax=Niabella aurantiaca TaxID=379900 RepID=UPI0003711786|nr:family 20 glycosylhydrolase [Niabella aurantiaca]